MNYEEVTVTGRKMEVGVGKRIRLTPAQANVRKYALSETAEKGVYVVEKMVEFCAGEVIGVETGVMTPRDLAATDAMEKKKAAGKVQGSKPKAQNEKKKTAEPVEPVGGDDLDPTK